jgi:putative ATPase
LFIDEIHRFSKSQQDAFLPYVENGTIVLIGATTENPSFEVINPLLSRSRVFVLKPLTAKHIVSILKAALADRERGVGARPLLNPLPQAGEGATPPQSPSVRGGHGGVEISDELLDHIAEFSDGDARIALNTLEMLVAYLQSSNKHEATEDDLVEVLQRKALKYDKDGEEHYNLISALHKSMRDSDPDGALYWLGRMLESGEDPLYIVRRVIRFASEDVGLAAPQGLQIAMAAQQACHFVGMPECNLALAQAVVYLATAPKSNALYKAYQSVQRDVYETMNEPVPLVIRNAPTKLMKELEYGKGYKYAHDYEDAQVDQQHLPDSLKGRKYYHPTERGFEEEIKKRMKK